MSQNHTHFNIKSDIPGYISGLFTFYLVPLSRLRERKARHALSQDTDRPGFTFVAELHCAVERCSRGLGLNP